MTVPFPQQTEEFFRKPNFMVIGTLRHDGTVQMSVVWYEYQDGVFRFSTRSDRAKYKNITRDPRVTFIILNKDNPYQYIQVQGKAAITTEGKSELIDRLSQRYTGNQTYEEDPEMKEKRVVITITPQSFLPWGFT